MVPDCDTQLALGLVPPVALQLGLQPVIQLQQPPRQLPVLVM